MRGKLKLPWYDRRVRQEYTRLAALYRPTESHGSRCDSWGLTAMETDGD